MQRTQSVRTARRSRCMGWLLATVLLAPGLGGCAMRSGAKTIVPARFDYSAAIQRSWKEEMLLNMVRLRYMDPPMFMDVQQVITQYTFDRSASAFWGGDTDLYPGASVSGRWAESPTITFTPMSGDRFIKSLLKPIEPASLISLLQAGWPVDAVFGVAVRSLNGLHAGSQLQLLKQTGDPEFFKALSMLRELQSTGAFSLRLVQQDSGAVVAVFRSSNLDTATLAIAREVRQLLKLNPDAQEFTLAVGETSKNDKEIAILTRSMFEILGETAAGVEIPASDQDEGRASKMRPGGAQDTGSVFKLRVRSSKDKPPADAAFAAVQYRNWWFWVDDRDLTSKRGLSFLLVMFALAESGPTPSPPGLTISKP